MLERFDELLRPGTAQARQGDHHADHRRRAAGGGDRGGRHPADRRQPDRARDRRPFPREPGSRGQHHTRADLPERLDEPLARAVRGRRLQQAARGADAGERLQGAPCDRQGARSRALHQAGAVRPRHARLRHDQPGHGLLFRRRAWARPATSASTSRRPGACSPRRAIRTAREFRRSRSSTPRTSGAKSRSSPTSSRPISASMLEPDTRDFPVLIDAFDKMDWDMVRLGSGGDYDPDDGLVDWMQTSSKFNGRLRDKDKMRVRLLLRCTGRRADRAAAARDQSGQAQGAGPGGQQDHLRQGGERLPVPPDGHPGPPQQREFPAGEPHPGPGRPRPHDGVLTAAEPGAAPPPPPSGHAHEPLSDPPRAGCDRRDVGGRDARVLHAAGGAGRSDRGDAVRRRRSRRSPTRSARSSGSISRSGCNTSSGSA